MFWMTLVYFLLLKPESTFSLYTAWAVVEGPRARSSLLYTSRYRGRRPSLVPARLLSPWLQVWQTAAAETTPRSNTTELLPLHQHRMCKDLHVCKSINRYLTLILKWKCRLPNDSSAINFNVLQGRSKFVKTLSKSVSNSLNLGETTRRLIWIQAINRIRVKFYSLKSLVKFKISLESVTVSC